MAGVLIAVDIDAEVGVGAVGSGPGGDEFLGGQRLFIQEDCTGFVYRDIKQILTGFGSGGGGGRQRDGDASHMNHAQAYQHERRQEEEHNVDKRNDLNPRFGIFGREFGTKFNGHGGFPVGDGVLMDGQKTSLGLL